MREGAGAFSGCGVPFLLQLFLGSVSEFAAGLGELLLDVAEAGLEAVEGISGSVFGVET